MSFMSGKAKNYLLHHNLLVYLLLSMVRQAPSQSLQFSQAKKKKIAKDI